MGLSYDIISEFAKITNGNKEKPKEGIVYATIVQASDGKYVKIDGSDLLTPTDTTTDIEDGERVTVMIKDHKATVTGNVTAPSASGNRVDKVVETVTEQIGVFETVVADKVSVNELEAYKATIENLIVGKADIEDLEATNAEIENLKVKNAEIENAVIDKADIEDLEAVNATIENLKVKDAEIENLVADKATINDLNAVNADIQNLKVKHAQIEDLVADKADIEDLEAVNATIENLKVKDAEIENAVVDNLEATKAEIGILNADFAEIKTLVSGNLTSDNILSFNITAGKVTMEDAFVKDAMIDTVNAAKINAGRINTNSVVIGSEDGGMRISGATQQFTDKNGNVRIQIGRDASNDFTFALYGEDGRGQIINQNGITASAIADGLIVNDMVSDNAAISGGKLDISSVVTEINNDNTTTINSNKIYLDEQNQSLEVAFKSLKTQVDTIKDIDSDLTTITDKIQSNTSKIEANKSSISTLLAEDAAIKKQVTDLEGNVVETTNTLTSKYTSLQQNLDGFKTTVNNTYATKTSVNDVKNNLSSNYSTTSAMNSAIKQKVDEISASVSSTYATKNEVKTIDNNIKANYSTTEQMSSAISVAKNEINLGISQVYETKTEVTNKVGDAINKVQIGGRNLIIRNTETKNYYIGMDGSLSKADGYGVSDYIKVDSGESLAFSKKDSPTTDDYFRWAWYGSDKTYINRTPNNSNKFIWVVPSGAAYVRISYPLDCYPKVERGTKHTDWTPAPEDVDTSINNAITTSKKYTDSQIKISKDAIELGVSQTYETKSSVTSQVSTALTSAKSYADTKKSEAISTASSDATSKANNALTSAKSYADTKKSEAITSANNTLNSTIANYYTKTQTDSQIKIAKDAINLGVSETYETKTNVTSKVNSAISTASSDATSKANNALTSAKSYADTKKSEAITSANNTLNSTIANYYTKTQTDSQINVAKNAITSSVSSTYETKTNVNALKNQINQTKQNIRCNDLGVKINYSDFSTANAGELYLHGYDSNNNPTNTNGKIYWNGATLTIVKGMINPNSEFPFNTDVYIFVNKTTSSTWIHGCYYNTSTKAWAYKSLIGGTSSATSWTPDQNHVAIGVFNMSEAEVFNHAYLFETPQSLLQLTVGSDNLASRMNTAEQKITTDAIVSTVTSSTTYKNNLTGKVDKTSIISSINQTAESIKISANKIQLDGNTTISAINAGSTTINGSRIQTGSITANHLAIGVDGGYARNPNFARWSSTYPDGTAQWSGSAMSKVSVDGKNVVQFSNTTASTQTGMHLYTSFFADGMNMSGVQYVCIEAKVRVTTGNFNGSCVLMDIYRTDGTYERLQLPFNDLGTPVANQWYTHRKIFKLSDANVRKTFRDVSGYALANWSGGNGGNSVKTMQFAYINFYRATLQDYLTQTWTNGTQINGASIKTGTLSANVITSGTFQGTNFIAGGSSNGNGYFQVKDSSNDVKFHASKSGIYATSMTFPNTISVSGAIAQSGNVSASSSGFTTSGSESGSLYRMEYNSNLGPLGLKVSSQYYNTEGGANVAGTKRTINISGDAISFTAGSSYAQLSQSGTNIYSEGGYDSHNGYYCNGTMSLKKASHGGIDVGNTSNGVAICSKTSPTWWNGTTSYDIFNSGNCTITSGSGGTSYRFANGLQINAMQIWGTWNITTAWGSVYSSPYISPPNYTQTFLKPPQVSITAHGAGTAIMVCQAGAPTTTSPGSYYLWKPVQQTGVKDYIEIISIGRWK